jgi:hypothetical protein
MEILDFRLQNADFGMFEPYALCPMPYAHWILTPGS